MSNQQKELVQESQASLNMYIPFLDFGDTRHHGGEYIIENGNRNHIYIVTQMYIVIAILC